MDDNSYLWISSVQKERSTYDPNIVFVRARNPQIFHDGVRVRVLFRNDKKRVECDVICNILGVKKKNCDSHVLLHKNSIKSMEKVFASEPLYLQWLGWKMIGHPTEWQFKTPYLTFYC